MGVGVEFPLEGRLVLTTRGKVEIKWRGFDHEILKALRKASWWPGFDHEVLIVLGEELWIRSLICI